MEHITRERFWTWPEERREEWARWFQAQELSLDDITEFTIKEDEAEVDARVILYNEAGRPYLDEEDGNSPASKVVTIHVETLDISGMADRPGTKTKLNVPPYH